MKKILFLSLIFCAFLAQAQVVTSVRGEVKIENRSVREGDRLSAKASISLGKNALLAFRKQNGNFVLDNKNAQKQVFSLADAKPANKVNMEGLRKSGELIFMSYEEIRDYFSVSGEKRNPTPLLLIGENSFRVDAPKYQPSPNTSYYLFPEGVEKVEKSILLPQKGNTFRINPQILKEKGFEPSELTFFKLIYRNEKQELAWITDLRLIFAEEAEIVSLLRLIVAEMPNEKPAEIEEACIEAIHAGYGMPNPSVIREKLIELGLKF